MPRQDVISVLAELDRYVLPYQWAGEDEVKVCCPFHDDETPSCAVSVSKRLFKCHAAGCGESGDIVTLLARHVQAPRASVLEELSKRYDLKDVKIVDPQVVDRWHDDIWRAKPLLEELRKRAVDEKLIRKYRLGEDGGRITIPVTSRAGDVINVRKYLPGAPGPEKMRNMRGRGAVAWFPVEQLRHSAVALCGGEMKAIVAAEQLNPHGVGAVCATAGEKLLPAAMLEDLRGKVVYVCMDVDEAGRNAALVNLRALWKVAAQLYDAKLPLDAAVHPKGDVNDFVAAGGDMWAFLQSLEEWRPTAEKKSWDDQEEPTKLHLSSAAHARHAGRRVSVTAVVTAMDTAPYVVPKDVAVKCDRSQAFCGLCPVSKSEDAKFVVPAESPSILEAVSGNKLAVHLAVMSAVGIPPLCKVCQFEADSHYNVEDVRLTPQLEITSRAADQKTQPAVVIGDGVELNETYELVGRMHPHPNTQQSTLVISKYAATQDALSTYRPPPEELSQLDAFRPAAWTPEALQERLDALYADFERSVTRIMMRREIHLAVDLSYHSPLLLTVDHRPVKGWTEVLIVGDSAQGKSEVANGLRSHYGLGEKVECKNMTVAGLLGGLQQMTNGRWMASWGVLPTHDKRHVTLEELKGTSVDVIGKLTDMRSSGVAAMTKIEKRQTLARTRILAISNARGDRQCSSYGYPVEAIKELIGGPEDVRRFDLCLVVNKAEADAAEINRRVQSLNGDQPEHSSQACRSLVLWCWTRTPEQVEISEEVKRLCGDAATRLCQDFDESIPIVDRGSTRFKVMRLAAALAGRTFSSTDDRQGLVVRPCHVEFVEAEMRRLYSRPTFGYLEFSRALGSVGTLLDPDQIRARIAALPFPYPFIESVLRCERIDQQDLQDWCSWDRKEAGDLLSFLVRKHALQRRGKHYEKTGPFIDLLRRSQEAKDMPGRPDFIREEY